MYCFLVIYRAFLVYQKWKISNMRLTNSSKILSSTNENSGRIFINYHMFTLCNNRWKCAKKAVYTCIRVISIFLIILYIIARYYRDSMFIFYVISSLLWFILIIGGTFVMYYSCRIKEAMLCVRETWVVIITILILAILIRIPFEKAYFWTSILGVFICAFFIIHYLLFNIHHTHNYKIRCLCLFCNIADLNCLVLIGMPLRMLYTTEGTLNVSKILYLDANRSRKNSVSIRISRLQLSAPSASNTTTMTSTSTIGSEVTPTPSITDRKKIDVKQPLYQYLNQRSNYEHFSQFLSECFVIVLLLFR